MQYVDTSVLVAYLVDETYSEQANKTLREENRYPLAISLWTETEFFSALGIKCRTKQITEIQWVEVQEKYFLLKPHFDWLPVIDSDYQTATELLKHWQTGLRAGDSLHLAIANRYNALLLSLDNRLVIAANQLGIAAECLYQTA